MVARAYDLEDRLIDFAVRICRLATALPATPTGKHVALQLTRSGTSPFANYAEARGAESRKDFVHKLRICLKELRETRAWLKFTARMGFCSNRGEEVAKECEELLAIIATSIKTALQKHSLRN